MLPVLDTRIASLWDRLSGSYWFIPALLTIAAISFAAFILFIDTQLQTKNIPAWLYTGEPGGARAILTTIAASMVSIASLTFSITMVVLTLASSQYGSRLLYNFMRDHANQTVLGIYIGTFIYCLLVLRQITPVDGAAYVPHLAVNFAILLALAGIGVLIFFIHHIAESIQANTVIANVSRELQNSIDRFFPEKDESVDYKPEQGLFEDKHNYSSVKATTNGTLQAVNQQELLKIAVENDFVIKLMHRAGDYLVEGTELLRIHPAKKPDDALITRLHDTFITGNHRNLLQDIEFAFHQLVEIALRALSPGINDPFTAISCIDEISAGLARIMQRHMPPRCLADDNGKVRVILDVTTFEGIVNSAFDQIRQHAVNNPAISIKLLQSISAILVFARNKEQRDALFHQARMMFNMAMAGHITDEDKLDIEKHFEAIETSGS